MLVETSLACDENGAIESETGTMRLHVEADHDSPNYRIGVDDASWLSSLGIAAGRHRSNGVRKLRARAEHDNDGDS
jgi:hypothetical protein